MSAAADFRLYVTMRILKSIMAIQHALRALIHDRRNLSEQESQLAMQAILEGKATEVQIAAFLVALHLKGETAQELTGAARALRSAANSPPQSQLPLLDTCGTGGDHSGTFNISTVAALVVAGAGLRVAKHGNRSLSSLCGSADLLEALGVDLTHASTTLERHGIAFFFAPLFHGATRHVQPVRAQLKTRTLFNYLGPLTNPAGANLQIAGAFSVESAALIAETLNNLGLTRGFVVHGEDGLDEVSTTSATRAFEIQAGRVTAITLNPEDFGLPRASRQSLAGGDIAQNCRIAESVLHGEAGPPRDIVLANAALALYAAKLAPSLLEAADLARKSIDSGRALMKLRALQVANSTEAA